MFGPVTSTPGWSPPSISEIGTTSPHSSGCRAVCRRSSDGASTTQPIAVSPGAGSDASISAPSAPRASTTSISAIAASEAAIAPASAPIASLSRRRMRSISRSSASRASRQALPISTTASGSTKTVAPLDETSCTSPRMWPRDSALIGIT